MYLGASHCITFLALATFVLLCWDIHVKGSIFYLYISCFNCLLIYVYEFFIDICLYYVLFEIKSLFYLLVFSTHAVMHFVQVFQEIYMLIQLSCYLLLQLMDSS